MFVLFTFFSSILIFVLLLKFDGFLQAWILCKKLCHLFFKVKNCIGVCFRFLLLNTWVEWIVTIHTIIGWEDYCFFLYLDLWCPFHKNNYNQDYSTDFRSEESFNSLTLMIS